MLNDETIPPETVLELYDIKHQIIDVFYKYCTIIVVVLKFNGMQLLLYVPQNDF